MSTTWWHDFFDETFADLILERELKELEKTTQFLIDTLSLKRNNIVFDQCCGTGNIANALAQKGMQVIGVDQSEVYINRAKLQNNQKITDCSYTVGDARTFVPSVLCDAAYNWYTSFGYSDNDAENIKMLQSVSKALKPGARFILDYTNPFYILQNFNDSQVIRKKINGSDLVVLKEASIDVMRNMFISKWSTLFPDGKVNSKEGESRIYFPRDLTEMFKMSQFENIYFLGSYRRGTVYKRFAALHSGC